MSEPTEITKFCVNPACRKPIEVSRRSTRKYCDAACRAEAFRARETVTSAILYPPVRARWNASGLKSLRYYINVIVAEALGAVQGDDLEQYREEE